MQTERIVGVWLDGREAFNLLKERGVPAEDAEGVFRELVGRCQVPVELYDRETGETRSIPPGVVQSRQRFYLNPDWYLAGYSFGYNGVYVDGELRIGRTFEEAVRATFDVAPESVPAKALRDPLLRRRVHAAAAEILASGQIEREDRSARTRLIDKLVEMSQFAGCARGSLERYSREAFKEWRGKIVPLHRRSVATVR